MAQTVGQHGVAAFTNPSNGDPLDATVVKANDNSVRGAYVNHDSDGGIHLQSSTLAARPVAGTAGRKWLTTDTGSVKLWFDTGAVWEEISYVPTTGNPSFTNATLVGTTTNNGEISGGTLSPSTLNLPAGTVIGSGTLSNATLSGTTTNSGTISGGTVSPTTLNAPSGTSLVSPTVSGTANFTAATLSGGTVAPTTLTVPSGTTIPTHTETGTITATGSTRNGGTLSGATLNNTTFTGTVSGINTYPTVVTATSVTQPGIGLGATQYNSITLPTGSYYVWHNANFFNSSATATGISLYIYVTSGTVANFDISTGDLSAPASSSVSLASSGTITVTSATATIGFNASKTISASAVTAMNSRVAAIRTA